MRLFFAKASGVLQFQSLKASTPAFDAGPWAPRIGNHNLHCSNTFTRKLPSFLSDKLLQIPTLNSEPNDGIRSLTAAGLELEAPSQGSTHWLRLLTAIRVPLKLLSNQTPQENQEKTQHRAHGRPEVHPNE